MPQLANEVCGRPSKPQGQPLGPIPMTFGPRGRVPTCYTLAAMNSYQSPADELVVADLMTLDPVVVEVEASIEEAEALMHDRAVGGLPVVDSIGDLVGVIGRTDVIEDGSIAMSTLLRRRPSGLRVGELMTSPAVTVSPTTPAARRGAAHA